MGYVEVLFETLNIHFLQHYFAEVDTAWYFYGAVAIVLAKFAVCFGLVVFLVTRRPKTNFAIA